MNLEKQLEQQLEHLLERPLSGAGEFGTADWSSRVGVELLEQQSWELHWELQLELSIEGPRTTSTPFTEESLKKSLSTTTAGISGHRQSVIALLDRPGYRSRGRKRAKI